MFSNVLCFVLLSDGRIRSVISFNRGGKWRQLKKPENVDCSEQTKRVGWRTFIHIALFPGHFFSIRKGKGKGKGKKKRKGIYKNISFAFVRLCPQCNLHVHGEHSRNNRIVPMLALSDPTAVGLVIAHGTLLDKTILSCPTDYGGVMNRTTAVTSSGE